MNLLEEIMALYADHGRRHIQPFVGDSFSSASAGHLRIAAVGINAYLCDQDWEDTAKPPKDREVHEWFRSFWRVEKDGFYKRGCSELRALGRGLAGSELFNGLEVDADAATKPWLYATNAIKSFLQQELVDSTKLDPALLTAHAETWHRELDVMAKHNVFPHVIVVFGELIWEPMWKCFYKDFARSYEHFKVAAYDSVDSKAPCYHHVNRLRIEMATGAQSTLLVRVAHPSRPSSHNAAWLLAQPEFRAHVGLPASR